MNQQVYVYYIYMFIYICICIYNGMTDGSEHCSFGYFKCTCICIYIYIYIFIDLLDLQPGLYKSIMTNHFGNNLGIILWDNEPYSTQ